MFCICCAGVTIGSFSHREKVRMRGKKVAFTFRSLTLALSRRERG